MNEKKFVYQSNSYVYLINHMNERDIEIPIGKKLIDDYAGKNILEIGNSIQTCLPIDFTLYKNYNIVDKFEQGKNIINTDIINYTPTIKYDLIISISTFEHIGFDESRYASNNTDLTLNNYKPLIALEHCRKLLSIDGYLIITWPLGFNVFFDSVLFDKKVSFDFIHGMKRIDENNLWEERDYLLLKDEKYSYPYRFGNAIIIAGYDNRRTFND